MINLIMAKVIASTCNTLIETDRQTSRKLELARAMAATCAEVVDLKCEAIHGNYCDPAWNERQQRWEEVAGALGERRQDRYM
jgi:hypothetical protein